MTGPRLNRDNLQRVSDLRAEEARLLLDNGHYPGAYYLLGYAVECALKACIAKQVRESRCASILLIDVCAKKFEHESGVVIVPQGLQWTPFQTCPFSWACRSVVQLNGPQQSDWEKL